MKNSDLAHLKARSVRHIAAATAGSATVVELFRGGLKKSNAMRSQISKSVGLDSFP